jgi:hypothetical protein
MRNTSSPERIACTMGSGVSDSAPTCNSHAPKATSQPIVDHLERNTPAALRSG